MCNLVSSWIVSYGILETCSNETLTGKSMLKTFSISLVAALVGLGGAFYYAGMQGLFITAILAILEISLSFENAIVNASVLKDMEEKWQQRFLTWGIIIAVFGMRLVFPLVLVSFMTELNPIEVMDLALEKPSEYAKYLHDAHGTISAFGGMFLLMVFFGFLLDHTRVIHWLGVLERKVGQLGNIEAIGIVIAIMILLVVQSYVPPEQKAKILIAGLYGMCVYVVIHGMARYMNKMLAHRSGKLIRKTGFISFIYLEILDASFSFDGVIGAFAVSKDIVIITLGLGIGAFFVRSITVFLVQRGTLQKYIFLEHGAYYALGVLATMMLLGIYYPIPEMLIGCVGAVVIGLAFISSVSQLKGKSKKIKI